MKRNSLGTTDWQSPPVQMSLRAAKILPMGFIKKQWFLLALVGVVSAGFLLADAAKPLADSKWLKWVVVAATMFLMAWPQPMSQFITRLKRPSAPLLGSFINIVIAPLLVWPLALLMPTDLTASMILMFASPCTLASAAVWTARAGGDDSVAILVTIITSGLCFLTTPAIVYLMLGQFVAPEILGGMTWKLLACVVLPICAAQLVRINHRSALWATTNKPSLKNAALCGILLMVFIGSVASANRVVGSGDEAAQSGVLLTVLSVVLMLAVHVVALFVGHWVARSMRLSKPEQIAVAFSGSQKTLMVALSVATAFGITVIPLVAYHCTQLLIDTLIADFVFQKRQVASAKG